MSHHSQRETSHVDEDTLPDTETLREEIEVPDGWEVTDSAIEEFAGYNVVAKLASSSERQGLLLIDRHYSRIACVLVPVPEVASGYKIEASEAIAQTTTVQDYLNDIEVKIQRREKKLPSTE
jgi:hypothetical protein